MNKEEFKHNAYQMVDWMADYLEGIENIPVTSKVEPGEIMGQLEKAAPEKGQSISDIFTDFKDIILPGMTHWQHPSFHAYFPGNSSKPSILAEMLTSTIGAQCMVWGTSPAAEELEQRMMEWLRDMLGLPQDWVGVIQDTASTATLVALLSAREQNSNINEVGFDQQKFTVYCSEQAHSSVDKAVRIAGFGIENLRKIAVDHDFAMFPDELERTILEDISLGMHPLCVIAAMGTTGSVAVDPIQAIGAIAQRHKIWLHVDAAYAGTGLILEELRWMSKGIEAADSFVFNPHKWMFTNFDCSAYFVKDKEALIKTFSITPEYLKTQEDGLVNNYRDWGIQLGRRFRALKLWFVIRNYGVNGIKGKLRLHLSLAEWLSDEIMHHKSFELLAPVNLNVVCFRYAPIEIQDEEKLNLLNERLLQTANATREIYFTHTKLKGVFTLRMVIGQTEVKREHVEKAWRIIQQAATALGD